MPCGTELLSPATGHKLCTGFARTQDCKETETLDAMSMHRMKCRPEAGQNQFQGRQGTKKAVPNTGRGHCIHWIQTFHCRPMQKEQKPKDGLKCGGKKDQVHNSKQKKNPTWTSYSYQERAQVVTACCNLCITTRMKLQPEEHGRGSTALTGIEITCTYYTLHTKELKHDWTLIVYTKSTFLGFSYI